MQQTFADVSFEQCRNPTRRERFLDDMNCVVPWANMLATIEPVYEGLQNARRRSPC